MKQFISSISLLVPDYDAALAFYVGTLGFRQVDDADLGRGKRWVKVAPLGATETCLLLAQADTLDQRQRIGDQSGGRVLLFLRTDDFARDHAQMQAAGVKFLEEPRYETYGTVTVFQDPFGNKWDLIEEKETST